MPSGAAGRAHDRQRADQVGDHGDVQPAGVHLEALETGGEEGVFGYDFSQGYKYENWGAPFDGGVYWNGAWSWSKDDVNVHDGVLDLKVGVAIGNEMIFTTDDPKEAPPALTGAAPSASRPRPSPRR